MADDFARYKALEAIAQRNNLSFQGVVPPNRGSPNYVRPDSGSAFIAVNVVLAAAALLTVLLRFYARLYVAGSVGTDDITIGIAMAIVSGSTALNCWAVKRAGLSRHLYDVTPAEIVPLLQFTYVLPMMYSLGVAAVKTSILFFYRRLFGGHVVLQRIVRYFLIFQVAFAVASLIALALICRPAHAWWVLEMRVSNCPTLRHIMVLYVSLRSVTVLCDVGMLLLPMRAVWRLQLPLRQRVGLLGVFALGFSACVVALVRLALTPRLFLTLDLSWTYAPIALLDLLEQCIGIITSSVPALTALITTHCKKQMRRQKQEQRQNQKQQQVYSQESIDFLAFAYDPDSQNIGSCYAIAYSTSPPTSGRQHGQWLWRGFRLGLGQVGYKDGKGIPGSDDDGDERLANPQAIALTTTVSVVVSRV